MLLTMILIRHTFCVQLLDPFGISLQSGSTLHAEETLC